MSDEPPVLWALWKDGEYQTHYTGEDDSDIAITIYTADEKYDCERWRRTAGYVWVRLTPEIEG